MGLIVENYTTENGLLVPELYIYVGAFRIVKERSRNTYSCNFDTSAFQTFEDRLARTNFVSMPQNISLIQSSLSLETLLEKNQFTIAYDMLKERISAAGYTFRDA
jgi:hypothetical protein